MSKCTQALCLTKLRPTGKTFKLSLILSVTKHMVCCKLHTSVLEIFSVHKCTLFHPRSYRSLRHSGAKSALIYPLEPNKPQPIVWKAVFDLRLSWPLPMLPPMFVEELPNCQKAHGLIVSCGLKTPLMYCIFARLSACIWWSDKFGSVNLFLSWL